MSKVFISHSSRDDIVSSLFTFLTSIGIQNNDIFCSSLEGNGVKNGERINDAIRDQLKKASIVIYLITNNFLKSTYCTQELGALWMLKETKTFIFKFDDVNDSDLKGFVDSSYKYNLFNADGLSSLYDELEELFNLKNKQAVISRAISKLLVDSKSKIEVLVDDKDKSDKEIQAEQIKKLENQYDNLSIGEKRIIGSIFFSENAVGYYQLSNGTVELLKSKGFVFCVTSVSYDTTFGFALQPWVINMINRELEIKRELEHIVKKQPYIRDSLW